MSTEPSFHIRTAELGDAESVRAGIQRVAAEKWFLATVEAFPLEGVRMFIARARERGLPSMVAVRADQVVGWCNIVPGNAATGFAHVGILGMGVVPECRRQGVGRDMLKACLALARDFGFEKVELEVFADNYAAIGLYQSLGFVHEGLKLRSRKLEGRYQDVALMGLWIGRS
jgi:ribosomal protein S18 acetylase RimI-like enzyme